MPDENFQLMWRDCDFGLPPLCQTNFVYSLCITENMMNGQRYTSQFKDQVVKLISEHQYSVTDVSGRLGYITAQHW